MMEARRPRRWPLPSMTTTYCFWVCVFFFRIRLALLNMACCPYLFKSRHFFEQGKRRNQLFKVWCVFSQRKFAKPPFSKNNKFFYFQTSPKSDRLFFVTINFFFFFFFSETESGRQPFPSWFLWYSQLTGLFPSFKMVFDGCFISLWLWWTLYIQNIVIIYALSSEIWRIKLFPFIQTANIKLQIINGRENGLDNNNNNDNIF
jgi:hypothetical protein